MFVCSSEFQGIWLASPGRTYRFDFLEAVHVAHVLARLTRLLMLKNVKSTGEEYNTFLVSVQEKDIL